MASLTLSDTHLQQLKALAESQDITTEALLQSSIKSWLDAQDPTFSTAADTELHTQTSQLVPYRTL